MPTFILAGWNWFANNKLARDIAIAVIGFIALVGGYKAWKWNVQRGVVRQQREEFERIQAEVKADVAERQIEVIREERTHADAAIAARDSGADYPDADSVPDEVADVLFRGRRRDRRDTR